MKAIDKIKELAHNNGPEPTSMEKLVVLAYYAGLEISAKSICDEHNTRIEAMREAANKSRYHHFANSIIDAGQGNGQDIICNPNYSQDVLMTFGGDEVDF